MTDWQHNALLDISGLPMFDSFKIEDIEPCLQHVLSANRLAIEALASADVEPDWDNFVAPMELLGERLERFWSPVSHLNAVKDSPELRQAYEKCLPPLSRYATELGQDERLYERFRKVADSPQHADLSDAQKRIVKNALRDFRLSGVDLPPAAKARFKEVQQRKSELSNQFSQNLLDATQGWYLHIESEDELAGLPGHVVDMAAQNASQRDLSGWVITLDAPSFIPFMTYADNRVLRRRLYEAYVTRASNQGPDAGKWDNSSLIDELLELRQQTADILGFESYADYSLETKMAESPAQVEAFILELAIRSRPVADAELDSLSRFAAGEYGMFDIEAWDLTYYSEKQRQSLFDFSEEEVRPYFPVDQVLQGMFKVTGRIFAITIEAADRPQVWHDEVRFFRIHDINGELLGQFYVDLFARSDKRGGAWMADCISRRKLDDGVQIPVAFLTCNFTPPVSGKPSLLTHDEVTTLFHEFGHGLHHMLTKVDYLGVSGISGVAWDAVELPSQFLENWCWHKESLDLIAAHFDSGEPLPGALLEKMRRARNFQSAMQMLRQLEFSLFDMRIHRRRDHNALSVQAVLDQVRDEISVIKPPAYNRFQNGFGHIFAGGYAAGYYSYKWAEVLSADAFSLFEENGIFDQATGASFRQNILEKGGTYDPMELFIAYRGRQPDSEALLRQSGIAA